MKTRFENIKLSVSRGGFSKIGPLKMLADLKTVGSAGRGDNRVMIQKLLVILVLVVFSNGTLGRKTWPPANDDGPPLPRSTCLTNTSSRLCGTKLVNIDRKFETHCFSCPINSYCAPDGKPEAGWVCMGNCLSENGNPTVECSTDDKGDPLCCEAPQHCIRDFSTGEFYCGKGEQPGGKPSCIPGEGHCRDKCGPGYFLCGKSPGLGLSAGPDAYENMCCSNSEMCWLNQQDPNVLGKPSCFPISLVHSCGEEEEKISEYGAAKCCEKGGEKWLCPKYMECGETKNTCGGTNFSFPPKSDFKVCARKEGPPVISCLAWNCPTNKVCGEECGQCLDRGLDIGQIADEANKEKPKQKPITYPGVFKGF